VEVSNIAKLPNLIYDGMEIIWPKDYKNMEKNLYSMFGLAVRKAVQASKTKGGEGKDETD